MKNLIATLAVLFAAHASAQDHSKPQDGTKQTDKSALEMTTIQKQNTSEITPNDRIASANGSLTVEHSNQPDAQKQPRQIPDGTYGTNRSNMVYSTENPNYPYDRDGKLIRNANATTVSGKREARTGTSAQNNSVVSEKNK